ncbi:MarR family winged helix-turn-helix transcriptional regulator [Propionivibrio sp.]|uniref:MarR family winged helix-turn-helix transcriptional regulator n=1 Tax=Propionivibrio sp. TaxID=2212460 RepID=UPI0039E66B6C
MLPSTSFPDVPPDGCASAAGDESFGLLLHFVRQGMIHHLERLLADNDLGVNFTQYRVLKQLAQSPCLSASELARRLEHDAGALTRLLDRLQESGFIQRRSCATDRRSVQISLTDAGRALARPLRSISDQLTDLALSDLSAEEKETVVNLLRRIRATLEHHSNCQGKQ